MIEKRISDSIYFNLNHLQISNLYFLNLFQYYFYNAIPRQSLKFFLLSKNRNVPYMKMDY